MSRKLNKIIIVLILLFVVFNFFIGCNKGSSPKPDVYLTPVWSSNINFDLSYPLICDGQLKIAQDDIRPIVRFCFGAQSFPSSSYNIDIEYKVNSTGDTSQITTFGDIGKINEQELWYIKLNKGLNILEIKFILKATELLQKENKIHQFYTTKQFTINVVDSVTCVVQTTPIVSCPGDAPTYSPTSTPQPTNTPPPPPTPAMTVIVNIATATIAKEYNFISGGLLEIPYTFTNSIPADADYDFQIISNQTTNNVMRTGAPEEVIIDKINKKIKFKPQATGSSINGTANRPLGLKYKIVFLYKAIPTQEFYIEQDDINRARQEYKWFQENGATIYVPNRDVFIGVDSKLYVGTTAANYPKEAFLNRQLTQLHTSISAIYPNVFYTSTWRNPYFNLYLGSDWASQYLLGKAVDCKPEGAGQTPEQFKEQWDIVITLADICLLEKEGRGILRSSVNDLSPLNENDPYYAPNRTWGYIAPGDTIELGYKNATHYHLDNRYH